MQRDHVLFADAAKGADTGEVRSQISAVADWDANRLMLLYRLLAGARCVAFDACDERIVVRAQRIEEHGDRSVRRHDVADAGERGGLKRFSERNGPGVDRRIDAFVEFHDERGIARRKDPSGRHASARSSLW